MKQQVAHASVRLSLWDRAGIWLSGVCIVHCLALPLMLLAVPLWPVLAGAHNWIHPVFAVLLIGTTLPAAASAWKRHHSPGLAILLVSGLLVVLLAMAVGKFAGIYAEDGLTLAGSALLVRGHWKNGRACARGACTHHGAQGAVEKASPAWPEGR